MRSCDLIMQHKQDTNSVSPLSHLAFLLPHPFMHSHHLCLYLELIHQDLSLSHHSWGPDNTCRKQAVHPHAWRLFLTPSQLCLAPHHYAPVCHNPAASQLCNCLPLPHHSVFHASIIIYKLPTCQLSWITHMLTFKIGGHYKMRHTAWKTEAAALEETMTSMAIHRTQCSCPHAASTYLR